MNQFKEEQKIGILRELDLRVAVKALCRKCGLSEGKQLPLAAQGPWYGRDGCEPAEGT